MAIPQGTKKIAEDIQSMATRGAGRIARAAVKGLMIATQESKATQVTQLLQDVAQAAQLLYETRPTAVSLPNGLRYFYSRFLSKSMQIDDTEVLQDSGRKIGEEFIEMSNNAVKTIGEIGARLIVNGDIIFTYCNSATAFGVLKAAHDLDKEFTVYVPETRPKYQGHITATWLDEAGIPSILITDNSVRYLMAQADKVFVGADAVTANGAVVNKIGTSTVALAADEARVDFYVAAESYKFSPATMAGELVEIEERDTEEVVSTDVLQQWKYVSVRNPAFDVTPPEFIDAIITEQGVIPPQGAIAVLYQAFGWFSTEQSWPWTPYLE
ncbi:MAG: ribose 1,5-bisphosphate isomerase [Candidatus Hermodarchaeota archaeon]|nr:ribose 1,5-bisphosphate isomerase [Candidatus Hermodarchaeota archaeon]